MKPLNPLKIKSFQAVINTLYNPNLTQISQTHIDTKQVTNIQIL